MMDPVGVRERCITSKLVPTDEVVLMIRHIKWGEHSVLESVEIIVRLVELVFLRFEHSVEIVVWNLILSDSDILNKILHVSVGGLLKVSQDTVRVLGVVDQIAVRSALIIHLFTEDMLVTQHVFDFSF